jgi:hypothetical protein
VKIDPAAAPTIRTPRPTTAKTVKNGALKGLLFGSGCTARDYRAARKATTKRTSQTRRRVPCRVSLRRTGGSEPVASASRSGPIEAVAASWPPTPVGDLDE